MRAMQLMRKLIIMDPHYTPILTHTKKNFECRIIIVSVKEVADSNRSNDALTCTQRHFLHKNNLLLGRDINCSLQSLQLLHAKV